MDLNAPPSAPPPPPPPPQPPFAPHALRRPLRRDRANGILGGVCAGVAETYGIDVTLVRVLWCIAAIAQIGIPAYIIAWVAIAPADGPRRRTPRPRDVEMHIGLVAVVIGALIATNRLLPHGWHFDHLGFPLLLIGGGLAILVLRRRAEDPLARGAAEPGTAAPTAESPTTESPTTESATTESAPDAAAGATIDDDSDATDEQPATGAPGFFPPVPPVPPSAWTQTAPWPTPPSARSQRRAARSERRAARPRSFITPLTLSVLLIGAGIASMLQATGAADVNLTVVLAIGTCIVGAALLTAAFVGRAHTLILVGLVLLAATAISNSVDVPLRGGIGTRRYHPLTRAELQSPYRLGIGELQLDLRDVPLAGEITAVDAQVGIGHLSVSVPSSVRVEVHAHAGAGSVMLFGQDDGGWPENRQRAVAGTGPGILRLDLRVGAGQVEVRRFEPDGAETLLRGN